MESSGKSGAFMRLQPTKQHFIRSSLAAKARAFRAARRTTVLRMGPGDENLFVPQGGRAIGVIVRVLAELAKVRLLVEGDGGRVVVAHLKRERGAPMQPRIFFASLKQREADAAPGKARVDRDRVDACSARPLRSETRA